MTKQFFSISKFLFLATLLIATPTCFAPHSDASDDDVSMLESDEERLEREEADRKRNEAIKARQTLITKTKEELSADLANPNRETADLAGAKLIALLHFSNNNNEAMYPNYIPPATYNGEVRLEFFKNDQIDFSALTKAAAHSMSGDEQNYLDDENAALQFLAPSTLNQKLKAIENAFYLEGSKNLGRVQDYQRFQMYTHNRGQSSFVEDHKKWMQNTQLNNKVFAEITDPSRLTKIELDRQRFRLILQDPNLDLINKKSFMYNLITTSLPHMRQLEHLDDDNQILRDVSDGSTSLETFREHLRKAITDSLQEERENLKQANPSRIFSGPSGNLDRAAKLQEFDETLQKLPAQLAAEKEFLGDLSSLDLSSIKPFNPLPEPNKGPEKTAPETEKITPPEPRNVTKITAPNIEETSPPTSTITPPSTGTVAPPEPEDTGVTPSNTTAESKKGHSLLFKVGIPGLLLVLATAGGGLFWLHKTGRLTSLIQRFTQRFAPGKAKTKIVK